MIVHVTPSYPPRLGGLEKVVQVLANTQLALGHDVLVITSDHGAKAGVVPEKFPVERLKSFEFLNTTVVPSLFSRLRKLEKTDVVHLHVTQAFTPEMVWLAAMSRHFPYVAHIHLDVPPTGHLGTILELYKSLFLRQVLKHAAKVVVPTEDYKELVMKKYKLTEQSVAVVPNATDHAILKAPKKCPQGRLNLLFVGRLSHQKNVPLLLQSLAYYAGNYGKNFHLNIVGDGELKGTLQNEVAELGLDKQVSFLGSLSGKALEDAYRDSDMFLLSSIAESFGLVLIEAMTKGLPIVSTNIPAVRNVIRVQKNGLLVKENSKVFAHAIYTIASDRKLYEQISVNNLLDAQNYKWGKVTERVLQIYEDVT